MQIQKNLTTINFNKSSGRSIKYIVIHYTGNTNDTAYNNTKYFKSANRNASAHYFVDRSEIWQCVEDKNIAWHCGSKSYKHGSCRNSNSIGVELCDGVPDFHADTIKNAVWLVRELMTKYNIPIENVIRHYDVTGKICPKPLVDEVKWAEFKGLVGNPSTTDVVPLPLGKGGSPLTSVNDIVWELANRGIISDKELWLKKLEEDTNAYWLAKKMVDYIMKG